MFRGEKQHGFTLIELMVALALIAIVITLSTPLSNFYKQNRVTSVEHEFVSSLNLARSTAVGTATPVSVCRTTQNNPNACAGPDANGANTWEGGWIVFSDSNSNCTIDAGETVLQHQGAIAAGYALWQGARDCVTYVASGILAQNSAGTWSLCDPSRDLQFKRAIDISITGRVTLLTPAQIQNQNFNFIC